MVDRRVVLATRSAGKIAELRELFVAAGFAVDDLTSLDVGESAGENALEVHETFEGNALAKAHWFAARLPGRRIVAEDSGLEVFALGGAPGVRSKRWTGSMLSGAALDAENNAALVRALAAVQGVEDRRARYVCAAVCVDGTRLHVARGESAGRILGSPRGDAGFGYDPWFQSDELGMTFAEASRAEKARVSHRGRAIRALIAMMRAS